MHLSVQFKIKSNPNYIRFLRENSYWYKTLNRDPNTFDSFVEEMKQKYKLTSIDKLNDILDKIKFVQSFMSIIN